MSFLVTSFVTSSHVEQLRKKALVLYAWEEDSVKIDVIGGGQEQQEDEQQGLLSSRTGTGFGEITLGSEGQTMPEENTGRIQKAM